MEKKNTPFIKKSVTHTIEITSTGLDIIIEQEFFKSTVSTINIDDTGNLYCLGVFSLLGFRRIHKTHLAE